MAIIDLNKIIKIVNRFKKLNDREKEEFKSIIGYYYCDCQNMKMDVIAGG